MFVYLFEAKSIQSYLFQSGKLKDVISASERLDRLIDNQKDSTLAQIIQYADLKTDLLTSTDSPDAIRFLRCKGGAFYCYSKHEQPLLDLRSLWTLTIEQMFPSLEYTDALTHATSLASALDKAHLSLACDRNTPTIKLPIAYAPVQRYSRTGNPSVPLSPLAKQATHKDDELEADTDTELNRQAYQALNIRHSAALQNKFMPDGVEPFSYPINLEDDFLIDYKVNEVLKPKQDGIKDIALIHIDGNGLGIILMALKNALQDKSDDELCQGFRIFSDALNEATIKAAKKATKFIYDETYHSNTNNKKHLMLPMRPIVLGGDDITLICHADLALEYSQIFCLEFKKESKHALKELFSKFLGQNTDLKKYLTASGGVLFHKAGNPFTHSHHLVEELCTYAKVLTKSVNSSDKIVGPAALAFHRLSNTVYESFDEILERSLTFNNQKIQISQAAYFIDESTSPATPFDLIKLTELVKFCTQKGSPVPISRWRQMATHIAINDEEEADRIYHRGRALSSKVLCDQLDALLDALTPKTCSRKNWYWVDKITTKHHSVINDMLIIHHFQSYANANSIANKIKDTNDA